MYDRFAGPKKSGCNNEVTWVPLDRYAFITLFMLKQGLEESVEPTHGLERGFVKDWPTSRRRRVSPFSRGVIFTRARVSLALLSLRKNGDYS